MKKLKVLLCLTQVANCGVGYYRQWLPLRKLEEKGLIELREWGFNWGEKESKDPFTCEIDNRDTSKPELKKMEVDDNFLKAFGWADVVYACRDERIQYIAFLGGLREKFQKEQKKKKPVIVDIDDYVQFTRPHNPGYLSFHPNSSYNLFNLKLLNIVDGMTVSTDYLRKVYKKENRFRYVCPNSLDIKWRDSFRNIPPTIKKKKDEVRIIWAGSAAHYENLKQLMTPLHNIMEKYENVTFHYTGLFGDLFNWPEFKDRIKTVKFSDLKHWPQKLKSMGGDIAVAPLVDNNFNRAKSNLRVLEYWAADYPVIASPILPYKFINNGKDGILAMEEHEWYEALESLILDKNKREVLIKNGRTRLLKEYDVDKNCMLWLKALNKFIK